MTRLVLQGLESIHLAKEKEMTLQIPSHLQFELISRYFTFQTLNHK